MLRDLLVRGAAVAALVFLFAVVAPGVLRVIDWITDDTPTPAEACAHLAEVMGQAPPDCLRAVEEDVRRYGDVSDRYLRCLGDTRDAIEVAECTDPAFVMRYQGR